MSKSFSEYNEEKNRFVAGAAKLLNSKLPTLTPYDLLMRKAIDITEEIRAYMRPILQAGGWKDEQALRETISKLYLERFSRLSKDELESLCTILHLDIMLEDIKSSPWGDDKPDLIS